MTRAHGYAPARAALAGNPSDGYGGATLAIAVCNYGAEVEVSPARALAVTPDSALVAAAVRRFAGEYGPAAAVAARWSTTIPREVGLAGSSAIVTATIRALCALHGIEIARERLPALVLAVEVDGLVIAAGLQDRVAQAFGGLTFMDFDPGHMAAHGHGRYEALDPALLPELFVAHRARAPRRSGMVHANLRARFERGEPAVVAAMAQLAELARAGRTALLHGDHEAFAECVDGSFDLRAQIMELDPRHVEMVTLARSLGASANYAGSGGAIVGTCRDAAHRAQLGEALGAIGCEVVAPTVSGT
jgi:glucuronokinase